MCRTIIEFEHVSAIGVDLVHGFKTLDLIKKIELPAGKTLFAGVVDGRNVWANDLAVSVAILEDLEKTLGKGNFSLLAANSGFRHKSSTGEFDSLLVSYVGLLCREGGGLHIMPPYAYCCGLEEWDQVGWWVEILACICHPEGLGGGGSCNCTLWQEGQGMPTLVLWKSHYNGAIFEWVLVSCISDFIEEVALLLQLIPIPHVVFSWIVF